MLNKRLSCRSCIFLEHELTKSFANLQEIQVTFCHLLKYPMTRDDQKLNKINSKPLLVAITKVRMPKDIHHWRKCSSE